MLSSASAATIFVCSILSSEPRSGRCASDGRGFPKLRLQVLVEPPASTIAWDCTFKGGINHVTGASFHLAAHDRFGRSGNGGESARCVRRGRFNPTRRGLTCLRSHTDTRFGVADLVCSASATQSRAGDCHREQQAAAGRGSRRSRRGASFRKRRYSATGLGDENRSTVSERPRWRLGSLGRPVPFAGARCCRRRSPSARSAVVLPVDEQDSSRSVPQG